MVSGELKQFHTVTIDFRGPSRDEGPETFTDFRLDVTFTRLENGEAVEAISVPGFWAADGNAAVSGAREGDVWRAHFTPPSTGEWSYEAILVQGKNVAAFRDLRVGDLDADGNEVSAVTLSDADGSFAVTASDKTGLDARAPDNGFLIDGGDGYLEFSGSGRAWLKTGVDSPENFLAYEEFDSTVFFRNGTNETRYQEHRDAYDPTTDPSWGTGVKGAPLGDEIIGASNYLASQGMNSIYIMPFTVGGDGRDTSPFVDPALYDIPRSSGQFGNNKSMKDVVQAIDGVDYDDFVTYDVSKLDQWGIFFQHMQTNGQNVHLVLQEQENDQLFDETGRGYVDGAELISVERAIYLREMVARFGHNPMLTWMLGEENTAYQVGKGAQVAAMFDEISALDPYGHMAAIHTFPGAQNTIYTPLLGDPEVSGASIQTSAFNQTYDSITQWVNRSESAGKRWVVMADETSDAGTGAAPDSVNPGHNDARSEALWGALMARAGGIEWYMGGNDQNLSDLSTREALYEQSVIAREFFETYLPFRKMETRNDLRDLRDGREGYVLAKENEMYLLYTEDGQRDVQLDLSEANGNFVAYWFDPFEGGRFELGPVENAAAGGVVNFGSAPATVVDNRVTDTALQGSREAIVRDAVLLVKRVDVDLGITSDHVTQGRLAEGDRLDAAKRSFEVIDLERTIQEDAGTYALTIGASEFLAESGNVNEPSLIYFFDEPNAKHGDITLAGEASVLFYTPDPDYFGRDAIELTFWDQNDPNVSATATLSILVTEVNDPPFANDGRFETLEGNAIQINPESGLAGDVDPDFLTYEIVVAPDNGTVDLFEGVIFNYTPEQDFSGADSFVYQVTDPDGLSARGTITVDVAPTDNGPTTERELVRAVNIGSKNSYTSIDGVVFEADTVSNQNRYNSRGPIKNTEDDELYESEAFARTGDLELAFDLENGDYLIRLHYAEIWKGITPTNDRIFDVLVEDQLVLDDLNLFATVGPRTAFVAETVVSVSDGELNYVGVDGVQNPKLSGIEIYRLSENVTPDVMDLARTMNEDGTLTIDAAEFGSVLHSNGLLIQNVSGRVNGTIDIAADGTGLTYRPAPEFFGSETLTVTIADATNPKNVSEAILAIDVAAVNDAPIAVDDVLSFGGQQVFIDRDSGLASVSFSSFDFLDNDIEDGIEDGDFITPNWRLTKQPASGEFTIAGEGTVIDYVFDPEDYQGSDSFTYQRFDITDGTTLSNEATVSLIVDDVPEPRPSLAQIYLANTITDSIMFEMSGSTYVDADSLAGLDLTVAAFAAAESETAIGSAKLTLFDDLFRGSRLSEQTENIEPYTLFGDNPSRGDYRSKSYSLVEGDRRRVEIEFFAGKSGSGEVLDEVDIFIEVDNDVFSDGFNTSEDMFAFDETRMGIDRIVNFSELDTLAFFGGSVANATDVLARATVADNDTVIDFGDGNVLRLEKYSSLSADDISVLS